MSSKSSPTTKEAGDSTAASNSESSSSSSGSSSSSDSSDSEVDQKVKAKSGKPKQGNSAAAKKKKEEEESSDSSSDSSDGSDGSDSEDGGTTEAAPGAASMGQNNKNANEEGQESTKGESLTTNDEAIAKASQTLETKAASVILNDSQPSHHPLTKEAKAYAQSATHLGLPTEQFTVSQKKKDGDGNAGDIATQQVAPSKKNKKKKKPIKDVASAEIVKKTTKKRESKEKIPPSKKFEITDSAATAVVLQFRMDIPNQPLLLKIHDKIVIYPKSLGWRILSKTNFTIGEHTFSFGLYMHETGDFRFFMTLDKGRNYHAYVNLELSDQAVMIPTVHTHECNLPSKMVSAWYHLLFEEGVAKDFLGNTLDIIQILRTQGCIFVKLYFYPDTEENGPNIPISERLIFTNQINEKKISAPRKKKNSNKTDAKQTVEQLQNELWLILFERDHHFFKNSEILVCKNNKIGHLCWKKYDKETDKMGEKDPSEGFILPTTNNDFRKWKPAPNLEILAVESVVEEVLKIKEKQDGKKIDPKDYDLQDNEALITALRADITESLNKRTRTPKTRDKDENVSKKSKHRKDNNDEDV